MNNKSMVKHPNHYNQNPSGVECIEIIQHMNFNVGSAVKYLWRLGKKDDAIQELKKARQCIDQEILRIRKYEK